MTSGVQFIKKLMCVSVRMFGCAAVFFSRCFSFGYPDVADVTSFQLINSCFDMASGFDTLYTNVDLLFGVMFTLMSNSPLRPCIPTLPVPYTVP